MTRKQVERWILLEQSGELSARQKRKLDRCPEAEDVRAELSIVSEAIQHSDIHPSPWATQQILSRLRADTSVFRPLPIRVWTPVIALAAGLMLVVAIVDFKPDPPSRSASVLIADVELWDSQFESDLVELEDLIVAISGSPLDIIEM